MIQKTIVVIGGALAGPTAASRAREIDEYSRIILLERNTRVSYALAGLSFHLSGEVGSLDDLNREREEFFKNVYNIEVFTRTEVRRIETKRKILRIVNSGKEDILKYDKLIFATGAASIHPEGLPDVKNFRYFRTLDDLAAIRSCIDSGKKRFVVLGAGSMGLEAADGLTRGGAEVTIIEKAANILPAFGENIAILAREEIAKKAKIFTGISKIGFEVHDDILSAVIAGGARIETDFLVSAIGVAPRTELLKSTGVKLHKNGTVMIDRHCRTSVKDIYACSICVSVPSGSGPVWIPQAAVADKTAQVAGANAAGLKIKLRNFSASMLVRLPGSEVGRAGISYQEALSANGRKKTGKVLIHSSDKEPYMPDSNALILELIYNRGNRKMLGLEALGSGVKSRLDAFTASVAGGLTIDDLAMLDFSYSPAFGTARDALNIAATVAVQIENGQTALIEPALVKKSRSQYFILYTGPSENNSGADLSVPLESLRSRLPEIQNAFEQSEKKQIAVLSETGRRGHLALRILLQAGIPSVNIQGGVRLFSRVNK